MSGTYVFTEVAYGKVVGHRRVAALGNNPVINTSASEDVWPGGGVYPWLSAATAQEIVSASANDTAAGTGARTVLVLGLDTNHVEQSETATLNGTTAVALTKTYLRINSAVMMSAGSSGVNAGDISIRDTGGGTTRAIIPAGYGITRQSVYTVPAGHTLLVRDIFACINRTGGIVVEYATFSTMIRPSSGFYRLPFEFSVSSTIPYRHPAEIPLPEKTDFCIRCQNVTANSTDVTAAWIGLLRAN